MFSCLFRIVKFLIKLALGFLLLLTICFVLAVVLFIRDTHIATEGKDPFYERFYGWDYTRLPLVKPFELARMKGFDDWILNTSLLPNVVGGLDVVDSIYCTDKFIYGHQASDLEGGRVEEHWFIIDLKEKKLMLYDSKEDFVNSKITPIEWGKMKSPNTFFEGVENNIKLPWVKSK